MLLETMCFTRVIDPSGPNIPRLFDLFKDYFKVQKLLGHTFVMHLYSNWKGVCFTSYFLHYIFFFTSYFCTIFYLFTGKNLKFLSKKEYN